MFVSKVAKNKTTETIFNLVDSQVYFTINRPTSIEIHKSQPILIKPMIDVQIIIIITDTPYNTKYILSYINIL